MGQSYRKTESLSESYHLPLGAAPPYLCLLRRNFCAAGGVLLWLQRCDFRTAKKPSPLTTAAQNIHVFLRKSPLLKEHFFELLKTAISSNACGTSTLKSPPPWAFSVPDVHQRVRKHLARCTLDCGFKTLESPALRGFVGGLRALATAALYLVLKSNGLPSPKIRLKKFDFSSKSVPANIAKKSPSQRCFKPLLIPIFNFPHKRPTFALTPESGLHTRLSEKDGTQRLTRRNRGRFGWGWYHYSRSVPHVHQHPRAGYQNGKFCRFWALVGDAPEERRKPSEQRCAYARRCSEGVAAPLGCVIQ